MMSFTFGSANQGYARQAHPRLLLSPPDLVHLRRRTERCDLPRRILDRLRRKVAPSMRLALETSDLVPLLAQPLADDRRGGRLIGLLHDMALLGALVKHVEARETVRRCLAALPAADAQQAVSRYLILAIRGEPDVPDLTAETALLRRWFEAALHCAISPGGYPEEDMGYGSTVAAKLVLAADVLRRADLYDAYAECPRLRRVGRALLHFTQPWGGYQIPTGDRLSHFLWREWLLARLAVETRDPRLLWLLGTLRTKGSYIAEEEVPFAPHLTVPATALALIALPPRPRWRQPAAIPPDR